METRKRTINTENKFSLLLSYIRKESIEEVKQMLHKWCYLLSLKDKNGRSALHYCTEHSSALCADLMIEKLPHLLRAQDNDGYTALHLSVISGNQMLTRYLISKSDINYLNCCDNEMHTAIHWATVCGELECLDLLLNSGAEPSTADIHGAFPIHYSAQMCSPHSGICIRNDSKIGLSVLNRLIQSSNVDVNCVDNDGRSPLLWAASAGSGDALIALINAGAKVCAQDKDGLTALHCASSRGHVDCVETLITLCGADINQMDHNGCSPLFYSVTLGHADCTQQLIQSGADVNRQDLKGRTAAHCGAAKGQFETIKILGQHGANLWIRNIRGDLPLHEAIKSGRKELVKWLLEQIPAAVNATNSFGRSPLHIAAINNNIEMCKILIDVGADVNTVMKMKGHFITPLDAALQKGYRAVAKYLLLHGALPSSRISQNMNKSVFHPCLSGNQHLDTVRNYETTSPVDSLDDWKIRTDSSDSMFLSQTQSNNIENPRVNLPKLPNLVSHTEHNPETGSSTPSSTVENGNHVKNVREFETQLSERPSNLKQAIITNVYVTNTPMCHSKRVPPLKKIKKKRKSLQEHENSQVLKVYTPSLSSSSSQFNSEDNNVKVCLEFDDTSDHNKNESKVKEFTSRTLQENETFDENAITETILTQNDSNTIGESESESVLTEIDKRVKSKVKALEITNQSSEELQTSEKKLSPRHTLGINVNEIKDYNSDNRETDNEDYNEIIKNESNIINYESIEKDEYEENDKMDVLDNTEKVFEELIENKEILELKSEEELIESKEIFELKSEEELVENKDKFEVKSSEKLIENKVKLKSSESSARSSVKSDKNKREKNIEMSAKTKNLKESKIGKTSKIEDPKDKKKMRKEFAKKADKFSKKIVESQTSNDNILTKDKKIDDRNTVEHNINKTHERIEDKLITEPSDIEYEGISLNRDIDSETYVKSDFESDKSTITSNNETKSEQKHIEQSLDHIKSPVKLHERDEGLDYIKSPVKLHERDEGLDYIKSPVKLHERNKDLDHIKSPAKLHKRDENLDYIKSPVKLHERNKDLNHIKSPAKLHERDEDLDYIKSPVKLHERNKNLDHIKSPAKLHERNEENVININNSLENQSNTEMGLIEESEKLQDRDQENYIISGTKSDDSKVSSNAISEKSEFGSNEKLKERKDRNVKITKTDGEKVEIEKDQKPDEQSIETKKLNESNSDKTPISHERRRKRKQEFKDKINQIESEAKERDTSLTKVANEEKIQIEKENNANQILQTKGESSKSPNKTQSKDSKSKKCVSKEINSNIDKNAEKQTLITDKGKQKSRSVKAFENAMKETIEIIEKNESIKRKDSLESDKSVPLQSKAQLSKSDITLDKNIETQKVQNESKLMVDSSTNQTTQICGLESQNQNIVLFSSEESLFDSSLTLDDLDSKEISLAMQSTIANEIDSKMKTLTPLDHIQQASGSPNWTFEFSEYNRSTPLPQKSRSESRCSHKLHFKTFPANVGKVEVKHIGSKVDSRRDNRFPESKCVSERDLKYRHEKHEKHEKRKRIRRIRPSSDGYKSIDLNIITQTVEKSLRKYQLERKLFEELHDLKRYQIRSGRSNEILMVKRLVDKFKKEVKAPGMTDFEGPYTYKTYELYLYDQLRKLSTSNQGKVALLTRSASYENMLLMTNSNESMYLSNPEIMRNISNDNDVTSLMQSQHFNDNSIKDDQCLDSDPSTQTQKSPQNQLRFQIDGKVEEIANQTEKIGSNQIETEERAYHKEFGNNREIDLQNLDNEKELDYTQFDRNLKEEIICVKTTGQLLTSSPTIDHIVSKFDESIGVVDSFLNHSLNNESNNSQQIQSNEQITKSFEENIEIELYHIEKEEEYLIVTYNQTLDALKAFDDNQIEPLIENNQQKLVFDENKQIIELDSNPNESLIKDSLEEQNDKCLVEQEVVDSATLATLQTLPTFPNVDQNSVKKSCDSQSEIISEAISTKGSIKSKKSVTDKMSTHSGRSSQKSSTSLRSNKSNVTNLSTSSARQKRAFNSSHHSHRHERPTFKKECLKPVVDLEPLEKAKNRPKFKRTKMTIPSKQQIHIPSETITKRWNHIKEAEMRKLTILRKYNSNPDVNQPYDFTLWFELNKIHRNSLRNQFSSFDINLNPNSCTYTSVECLQRTLSDSALNRHNYKISWIQTK